MGPTWVLSAPDGPHVGPVNLAIREYNLIVYRIYIWYFASVISKNTPMNLPSIQIKKIAYLWGTVLLTWINLNAGVNK